MDIPCVICVTDGFHISRVSEYHLRKMLDDEEYLLTIWNPNKKELLDIPFQKEQVEKELLWRTLKEI
jgi:Trm5-related predicted tRNA methylase